MGSRPVFLGRVGVEVDERIGVAAVDGTQVHGCAVAQEERDVHLQLAGSSPAPREAAGPLQEADQRVEADRDTSSAVVRQLQTEMRSAARPLKVIPDISIVPSAGMPAVTCWVISSITKATTEPGSTRG